MINFEYTFRDTHVTGCTVFRQYESLFSTILGRYSSREIQNWSPTQNDVIETIYTILNITILFSTIDYPMIDKRIASITLIENFQYQTILAKSPVTLCIFLIWTEHSPPSSPQTMLVTERSTCGNGKIFRAQQRQVSREQTNIVLGGRGLASRRDG